MEPRTHAFSRRRLLGTAAATAAAGTLARMPLSALASVPVAQTATTFVSADQLYLTLGAALEELVADSAGEELRGLEGVLAMQFTNPAARIIMALSPSQAAVDFDGSGRLAEVTLALTGDLAHALASGQVPIEEALLDPDLRWTAKPPEKVRQVIGLPAALTPFYIPILDRTGFSELVPKPSPPAFASAENLYETVGRVIRASVAEAPDGSALKQYDGLIAWRFTDPTGEIGLNLGERRAVTFGASNIKPDGVVVVSGDDAHRLFSGSLDLIEAIGRGLLTCEGDTGLLNPLSGLLAEVRPRYGQLPHTKGSANA